jgi:hypothetical protein
LELCAPATTADSELSIQDAVFRLHLAEQFVVVQVGDGLRGDCAFVRLADGSEQWIKLTDLDTGSLRGVKRRGQIRMGRTSLMGAVAPFAVVAESPQSNFGHCDGWLTPGGGFVSHSGFHASDVLAEYGRVSGLPRWDDLTDVSAEELAGYPAEAASLHAVGYPADLVLDPTGWAMARGWVRVRLSGCWNFDNVAQHQISLVRRLADRWGLEAYEINGNPFP